ncbi:AAA family ATPase [Salinisphaera orenii]|uniref:Regulatory protein n=1 Tax=Salinisphaera orenii YIM 95161 TaxID=1051139 RepID=A0A423PIV9_9GAMM|nr:helicase RepA family protein [Salinisphaera halophila]ROO25517.1 hypothetical protein SAHL_14310 [Salinisphaera halophila YIM 95161]
MGEALRIPQENPIEPLCDPCSIGIGRMLDEDPPDRRWLVDEFLPLGIVGVLAATGGTGKSFLTLQASTSIAAGIPFMGMPVVEPGGVLMLCAEDDRDELHRRFKAVIEHMRADNDLDEDHIDLLRERLFIEPRVGLDNRVTREQEREIVPTMLIDRIASLVGQLPPINLIVLDPISRFRGGDENDNAAATRFIEQIERLRNMTGATILLPHHVAKNSFRASDGLNQDAMRGASALADAGRWAAGMATLRADEAGKFNVEPEEAHKFVWMESLKHSYGERWPGQWLKRSHGGVLAPTDLERKRDSDKRQKAESDYREIVARVCGLIREEGPLSLHSLENDYSGTSGLLGAGHKKVRGVIHRAVKDGDLRTQPKPKGRGDLICLPSL